MPFAAIITTNIALPSMTVTGVTWDTHMHNSNGKDHASFC